MSFEGITEVKIEEDVALVNARLADGWELLAITSGVDGPMYPVGRRAQQKDVSESAVFGTHVTRPGF